MSEVTTQALESVLTALSNSADKESDEMLQPLRGHAAVEHALSSLKERDFQQFYYLWSYPQERLVGALARQSLGDAPELAFLAQNYAFLTTQLAWAFRTVEGPGCSADKAHTVFYVLIQHFQTKAPILFNYEQRYTFHLPSKVLKTHEEIIEFFNAAQRLLAGLPLEYGRWASSIQAQAPTKE